MRNGGEGFKVGELSAAVIFELEAYPEPKILSTTELRQLLKTHKTAVAVAKLLGCSQVFVSDHTKQSKKSIKRGK
jgi:hypothetical protein